MSLNINLPSELEHAVRERALAAGLDIDTFVAQIFVEQIQDELLQPQTSTHKEFRSQLERVIALHPKSSHPVDDSRESIYAGRGE
jgi:hypothetical protein